MLAYLLKRITSGALWLAIVCGLLVASGQSARAQRLTVLHSFEDSGGDGGFPDSAVVLDAQGNVYGETRAGGKRGCYREGCGILFSVTPGGVETILYTFPSNPKSQPRGGLIWDAEGNLYGTAEGAFRGRFDGGVFKLRPGGNLEWIFLFSNQGFGENPAGGVVMDGQGNLYGTTIEGGMANLGAVFELKQNGSRVKRLEDTLYSFAGGNDGDDPGSRLILDGQGNLYGTTPLGGGSGCYEREGCGTVFELTPRGKETILYRFTGGADGGDPLAGVIMDAEGNLYGTTSSYGNLSCGTGYGCGTVFKLAPDGALTVLHTFTGEPDGELPYAGLTMDAQGNLYGTTSSGGDLSCGSGYGCGTVYELTTDGTFIVLHSFSGEPDGAHPYAGLIMDVQGNLYGTTGSGGAYDAGTVFKLTP